MLDMHKNTIFFLGAGFSKGAGAPLQSELMSKVLSYDGIEYDIMEGDFRQKKNKVIRFLMDAYNLRPDHILKLSLEDVYTPIDKCISEGASFRGYSYKGLTNIRSNLSYMISVVIDHELTERPYNEKEYARKFARYVIDNNASSDKEAIIISTNWDILVDRAIVEASYSLAQKSIKIDYGTSIVPIHSEAEKHLYNDKNSNAETEVLIRLYKMHGSLNWLRCPTCNRIFGDPQCVNRQLKVD